MTLQDWLNNCEGVTETKPLTLTIKGKEIEACQYTFNGRVWIYALVDYAEIKRFRIFEDSTNQNWYVAGYSTEACFKPEFQPYHYGQQQHHVLFAQIETEKIPSILWPITNIKRYTTKIVW